MARRITTGKTGKQILGSIVADNNSLKSVVAGDDIVLSPEQDLGNTAVVQSTAHFLLADDQELRLSDGTTHIGIKAPATITGGTPVTLVLPPTDGDANQVLATDGNGILSWETSFVSIDDASNTDSSDYFPTLFPNGGDGSTLNTSSSRLKYNPNPGRLTVEYITTNQDITVGGDLTAATGTVSAQTLTETSSIVLKENINPLVDAIEKVLKLDGVTYTRKSTGQTETGLIAEEVEKIAPELVEHTGEHKAIQYSRLTAYLIESVKYLKDELDKVKNTNG